MNIRLYTKILAVTGLAIAGASTMQAQATRTWVSGVGDDANPCSRTAPCKTFAGAISKTAAGGEIDALDAGGFGSVTITKAITIDGGGGIVASILAIGVPGVTVNAGTSDRVTLRNLRIQGASTSAATGGTTGVRFLQGASLEVENCVIENFNGVGVDFLPSNAAVLTMRKSVINANGVGNLNGGQVDIAPSGSARASLIDCQITNGAPNGFGLAISGTSKVSVTNSMVSNNRQGVVSNASEASLEKVTVTSNQVNGLHVLNGGVIRISDTSVTYNNGPALQIDSGGQVLSFGQNHITGNSPDTSPSGTLPQQ